MTSLGRGESARLAGERTNSHHEVSSTKINRDINRWVADLFTFWAISFGYCRN